MLAAGLARMRKRRRRAAGGFDPSSIAGLKLWLKADSLSLSDGDPVTMWADSSGQGNDATQATAAKKPTYRVSIINGRPVVRFDGVDDFLATAAFAAGLSQPNTIILVAKKSSASFLGFFDGIAAGSRNAVFNFPDGTLDLYAGNDTNGGTLANNTFQLLVGQFNAASSFGRVNGTQSGNINTGSHALTGATVGSDYTGAGNFLTGDMAEVLVYNAALSGLDIVSVESYLNTRYAIY